MATSVGKNRCVTCGKDKATMRCGGCLQEICFDHLVDHRQELGKQLDEIELTRDLFRQTLTQQTTDLKQHPLIERINDWEHDSIKKIQQKAEETRQILFEYTTKQFKQIEIDLNNLTDQLRQSRKENDFYETDLRHWNEEISRLTNKLNQSSNINLQQNTIPLINNISVDVTSVLLYIPNIDANAKWIQNGVTVAGGNGEGNGFNQLSNAFGLYTDDDQTIYVADHWNHRVIEWKNSANSGRVVAGGNEQGNRNDQLNKPANVIVDKQNDSLIICDYGNQRVMRWPRRNGTNGEIIISDIDCRGLAIDNDGYLYVSDVSEHEVRRWRIGDTSGTLVAGGNGCGSGLDQLDYPCYIFVDQDRSVYVSDGNNHRVIKWLKDAKEGIVVAGGQGFGNGLTQSSDPREIVVDQLGAVYVADSSNDRVMRWVKDAREGSVIAGGNGSGVQPNQLNGPRGISLDRQGNLYVTDFENNRVQKFIIDLGQGSASRKRIRSETDFN